MTAGSAADGRPARAARHRRRCARPVPRVLLTPAVVAFAFLVLPLAGLVVRAPWGQFTDILSQEPVRQALWLSLWTSTTATAVATLLGVPLAWMLARTHLPGRALVRALVTIPLVLPPVVGGVALLLAFGRNGFLAATSTSGSGSPSRSLLSRS